MFKTFQKQILEGLIDKKASDKYITLNDCIGDNLNENNIGNWIDAIRELLKRKFIFSEQFRNPNKIKLKQLRECQIKITPEGEKYYHESFSDKFQNIRLRKFAKWLPYLGVFLTILAISLTIYNIFFANKNSMKAQLSPLIQDTVKSVEISNFHTKPPIFKDNTKINVLISRFEDNVAIQRGLYDRFQKIITDEDSSMIDILAYNDTLNIPFSKKDIINEMNYNNIDLLVFGNVVPHNSHYNSDTSKIYYMWALPKPLTLNIQQINTMPVGTNYLSLNDIYSGKNQEFYDLIIYFSLAKKYILSSIHSENDTIQWKKGYNYLLRAQKIRKDESLALMILMTEKNYNDSKELPKEIEVINRAFSKNSKIYKYSEFLVAENKLDTVKVLDLGEQLIKQLSDSNLNDVTMHKLILRRLSWIYLAKNDSVKHNEAFQQLYVNDPTEVEYLQMSVEIGKNQGFLGQAGYLEQILKKHPNYQGVKKLISFCYYSLYKMNLETDYQQAIKYLETGKLYDPNIENADFSMFDVTK